MAKFWGMVELCRCIYSHIECKLKKSSLSLYCFIVSHFVECCGAMCLQNKAVASCWRGAYSTLQAGQDWVSELQPERHPAGCMYPGTSLVWAACSVVTAGSFEGMQTATGTCFLPADSSALKGQGSDPRLQIGWLLRWGTSGWHVGMRWLLFGVRRVTAVDAHRRLCLRF